MLLPSKNAVRAAPHLICCCCRCCFGRGGCCCVEKEREADLKLLHQGIESRDEALRELLPDLKEISMPQNSAGDEMMFGGDQARKDLGQPLRICDHQIVELL